MHQWIKKKKKIYIYIYIRYIYNIPSLAAILHVFSLNFTCLSGFPSGNPSTLGFFGSPAWSFPKRRGLPVIETSGIGWPIALLAPLRSQGRTLTQIKTIFERLPLLNHSYSKSETEVVIICPDYCLPFSEGTKAVLGAGFSIPTLDYQRVANQLSTRTDKPLGMLWEHRQPFLCIPRGSKSDTARWKEKKNRTMQVCSTCSLHRDARSHMNKQNELITSNNYIQYIFIRMFVCITRIVDQDISGLCSHDHDCIIVTCAWSAYTLPASQSTSIMSTRGYNACPRERQYQVGGVFCLTNDAEFVVLVSSKGASMCNSHVYCNFGSLILQPFWSSSSTLPIDSSIEWLGVLLTPYLMQENHPWEATADWHFGRQFLNRMKAHI